MSHHKNNIVAKPFVKWAGGKGSLLKQLEELLPPNFDELSNVTYIEPFVGGGAMLFYMLQNHKCISRAVINDINKDLIRCYQLITTDPRSLIERLRLIERNYYSVDICARKELYYAYRDMYNRDDVDLDEKAALLIFLNHTCFNGLYRVNTSGKFNVPFGNYKKPIICNEEMIMTNHRLLSSIELIIREPGDYRFIQRNLSRKNVNFIYFDPPYRPLLNECNFKSYSNSPFGDKQQEELKELCDKLTKQRCMIMLSNSDSKNENGESYFEDLYVDYYFDRVYAPRFINAFPEKRVKLTEVVIRNYNK